MSYNLIPAARVAMAARRRRTRAWAIGLSVYATLAVSGAALSSSAPGESDAAARAALAEADQRLAAAERRSKVARAATAADARRIEAARAVAEHPDWSRVLRAVSGLCADRIVLEKLELSPVPAAPVPITSRASAPPMSALPSSYTLVVAGVASGPVQVSEFVLGLERLGVFDSVAQREVRGGTTRGRETVTFRVECSVADKGGA